MIPSFNQIMMEEDFFFDKIQEERKKHRWIWILSGWQANNKFIILYHEQVSG